MCRIDDTASLYLTILASILAGKEPCYSEIEYYLAALGIVAWDELCASSIVGDDAAFSPDHAGRDTM